MGYGDAIEWKIYTLRGIKTNIIYCMVSNLALYQPHFFPRLIFVQIWRRWWWPWLFRNRPIWNVLHFIFSGMQQKCLFPCKQLKIYLQFGQISLQYGIIPLLKQTNKKKKPGKKLPDLATSYMPACFNIFPVTGMTN